MALPSSTQAFGARVPRIHQSQMVLSYPKKYPVFKGKSSQKY